MRCNFMVIRSDVHGSQPAWTRALGTELADFASI